MQVAPAMAFQRRRVRRGRSVERELLTRDPREPLELLVAGGGDHEGRTHDLHVGAGAARRRETPVECGQGDRLQRLAGS